MVDIATDSNGSPDVVCCKLPLWYRILVCLGSAGVGGYFGAFHGFWGIIFSAVGGVGVAVFWLNRVRRFQTPYSTTAIFGGILWGMLVGVVDTFWLHLTAWGLGYDAVGGGEWPISRQGALFIGSILGVIAGGIYGLVCMIILEVHRSIKQPGQA